MADTIYNKTADPNIRRIQTRKGITDILSSATGYKNWTHNDGEGDPGGVEAVQQIPSIYNYFYCNRICTWFP